MRHTYLLSIISITLLFIIASCGNHRFTTASGLNPKDFRRIGTEPERLPTKSGRAKDRLI